MAIAEAKREWVIQQEPVRAPIEKKRLSLGMQGYLEFTRDSQWDFLYFGGECTMSASDVRPVVERGTTEESMLALLAKLIVKQDADGTTLKKLLAEAAT